MGKSCSGKSCMARPLSQASKGQAARSKEAMVRAYVRLLISAPINQMRPHKIFAGAPASGPQGPRREPGQGERPRSH